MRNLRNIKHVTLEEPLHGPISKFAWDVISDSVIFTSGPTEQSTLIELRRCPSQKKDGDDSLQSTIIAAWDAPCPIPDLACDHVLDIQHFADTTTTCLVLAGGDIVVVREQALEGEDKIEIVGSVDVGIAAACWAPDEELLAICTRSSTLLFMTRDFDNVASVDILQDDIKASKHVSVGWGKAETQFRGKGAKALRDPTMPEEVEEGLLSKHDDQSTTISWRGDGQFIALNSLQASHRRVLRIYSREGVLDGVTEPVDNLEGALSWRPAGNLLAGVQRLEAGAKVILFERNGLRHGEFSLRLNEEDLKSWASSINLSWNADSAVLAVTYKDRVHLWTMGNYHYYLKGEVPLAGTPSKGALSLKWHPERHLMFAVGLCDDLSAFADDPALEIFAHPPTAQIDVLEYLFVVCKGSTNQPNDNGAVAVIDGGTLKLTDMRYSNTPPPMAAHEVSVGSNIIDCAMKNSEARKIRIAVLTNDEICIIDWTVNEPSKVPTIHTRLPHDGSLQSPAIKSRSFSLRQIALCGTSALVLLGSAGADSVLYSLDLQVGKARPADDKPTDVQQITSSGEDDEGRFYLNRSNGDVVIWQNLTQKDFDANGTEWTQPTNQCTSFEVTYLKTTSGVPREQIDSSEEFMVVSMAKNGQLSINQKVIASSCTSFLTTRDHIIFTTSKHLLKFVHVDALERLEVPADTPEDDERCRSIERGAKLVTVIPSRSALILQMPRGNLETIYPRALVLAQIRRDINRKYYKRAFLACRNHRVDMNILHDHKPKLFLQDIPLFIDQVAKIEYIDLFLSQLRNEDVSLTMYKETSRIFGASGATNGEPPHASATATELLDSKVNGICDAFIRALRPKGSSHLQSLITAHVCKSPPDLVSGLKEVSKLQETGSEDMESAVEHICFLVDVHRLYDAALGLYDLKLALLVAQQSQKDPREYLPFLNKLHAQPFLRRKYDIDSHLGRKRLCLEHLKGLNAFEEFKEYTVKHELYHDSLELYKYQEDKTEALMKLFAEYLMDKSRYKEAGIAFEYLRNYTSACEAYRLAHLWREALASAHAVPFEPDQMRNLAQSLCDGLIELKEYFSAGTVMLDHLQDVQASAKLFCKGYFFSDAARILSVHSRRDVLDSILDAGLAEGMANMTELLADFKGQLNAQVPRIQELRLKREQEPLAFYDAAANEGADIPDNVSLAATDASTLGGTLLTRYTNRTGTVGTNATRKTSKNRRREERKRARGKKGSVYEEEYLVNSVGRLIDRVNSVQEDVSRLIMGLVQRRMRERAKAVQDAMASVVEVCQKSVLEVFPAESASQGEQNASVEDPGRLEGADGVHWESMEALRTKQQPPVVKSFARLALA